MKNCKKLIPVVLAGILISMLSVAAQAKVAAIGSRVVSVEGGEDYTEVIVRCTRYSDLRVIVEEPSKQGAWCSKEISGEFCGNTKLASARSICSLKYTRGLAEQQETAKREALENAEMKVRLEQQEQEIQQKILALEPRKQSLLQREAEIDRRELELKRQLVGR